MKNSIFVFALAAIVLYLNGSFILSGNFENPDLQQPPVEALWETPTGYLIPYSESENWEEYVRMNLPENLVLPEEAIGHVPPFLLVKHYSSRACSIKGSRCSFECIQTRTRGTCIRESECAPCINCC